MDLLSGYVSEDNDIDGPQHGTRLGQVNASPMGTSCSVTEPAGKKDFEAKLQQAQPAPQKKSNAHRPRKRKALIGKFGCGIDYGDISDIDINDEIPLAKTRLESLHDRKARSIVDLLPPPVASIARADSPQDQQLIRSDDDDIVPGTEDPRAMFLGTEQGEESEDAIMGNDGSRQGLEGSIEPKYNPSVGAPQYSSPSGVQEFTRYENTAEYYNLPVSRMQPVMPSDAAILTALGSDAARGGGIKFKEISGSTLRYMEPGARAEQDALRSALGSEYESKLRADAAKVGGVSKLAKRRHQLSSLYVQAKEQELDDLEKRATGMKTKAETHRKYGW